MSGCPEKDLHSIYIDGEMPEKYAKEYEAHIALCEKCRKELEKARRVSMLFREDAISKKLDQQFLDHSFERLQTKLRYSANTKDNSKNILPFPVKWTVPLAAAAALFAVVITPLSFRQTPAAASEIKAIARTEIKPITENKVVVDGNFDRTTISRVLNSQKVVSATNLASTAQKSTASSAQRRIIIVEEYPDIDVFRPDFNNSSASVRIEFPDMNSIPMRQENLETK